MLQKFEVWCLSYRYPHPVHVPDSHQTLSNNYLPPNPIIDSQSTITMSSSQTRSLKYSRRVCTCQAYDCILGRYLDANGITRNGVELRPEAYEAHQRAELRNSVQSGIQSNWPASGLPSHYRLDNQTTLSSCLEQLALQPRYPPTSPETEPRVASSIQQDTSARSATLKAHHLPISQLESLDTSDSLISQFSGAQEVAIRPYSCGMYIYHESICDNTLHSACALEKLIMTFWNLFSSILRI